MNLNICALTLQPLNTSPTNLIGWCILVTFSIIYLQSRSWSPVSLLKIQVWARRLQPFKISSSKFVQTLYVFQQHHTWESSSVTQKAKGHGHRWTCLAITLSFTDIFFQNVYTQNECEPLCIFREGIKLDLWPYN